MQIGKRDIKNNNQISMKMVVMNLSAFLFLGILFSFQIFNTSFGSSHITREGYNQGKSKNSFSLVDLISNDNDQDSPFGRDTDGTEPPEENEFADDDVNELDSRNSFANFIVLAANQTCAISKITFFRNNSSFHKRKAIPLFILQQSWKTFIS